MASQPEQSDNPNNLNFPDGTEDLGNINKEQDAGDIGEEVMPIDEVDYTLGLPRPFGHHFQLMEQIRESQIEHYDPSRHKYGLDPMDAQVITEPNGVISLHILEVQDLALCLKSVAGFSPEIPSCFYCLITVGGLRRMTRVAIAGPGDDRIRIDSLIHFSMKVAEFKHMKINAYGYAAILIAALNCEKISRFREDPSNRMRLELWAFQDPEAHFMVGNRDIHVYDFIHTIHGIETVLLGTEGSQFRVGLLSFEFTFTYGAFGYGHSNQLKNTDYTVFEVAANSLFPRLASTPDEITDSNFQVRIPKKFHMVNLSSMIFEVPKKSSTPEFHAGKSIEPGKLVRPKAFSANQVEYENGVPIFCKANMSIHQKELEAEFNDVHGQILSMPRRRDRLQFLYALVEGRIQDLPETNTGALFTELNEQELESVVDEDKYETYHRKVYPTKSPCIEKKPVQLLPEDEEFLKKFPSLTRTTGWLGRLFGYSPIEGDPHYLQPEFPLQEVPILNLEQIPPAWYQLKDQENWLQWLLRMIIIILHNFYLCLFPELHRPIDIPEISVTLATPEGALTDVYTQWFAFDETKNFMQEARELVHSRVNTATFSRIIDEEEGKYGTDPIGAYEEMILARKVEQEMKLLKHAYGDIKHDGGKKVKKE